jgi:hypothetical protein
MDNLLEIVSIRTQARHFRDIGMKGLMHAAYRSARMRLRELRGERKITMPPCYCGECRKG